jgi:hypothetical protein
MLPMPGLKIYIEGETRPSLYPQCQHCPILQEEITDFAEISSLPQIAVNCQHKEALKLGIFTIRNPQIIMHLAGQIKPKLLPPEIQDGNQNAFKNGSGIIVLGLINTDVNVTTVCPGINNHQP